MLTLLQRLKLRHKIAALGVVGMALCLLPLIQLLRWQGLELRWTQAAQEALEPALQAVELQRGLVEHRASAAQWLQGQRQADVPRRRHQAVVDARLAVLIHRLPPGAYPAARTEAVEMHADWTWLVQQVVEIRCTVPDSDAAHRLLVEQALQVIDIVTATAAPEAGAGELRQAAARARAQIAAGPEAWAGATATLATAQARLREEQARTLALHRAGRTLAAAGLLALGIGIVGLLAWLHAALRRTQPFTSGPGPQGAAAGWHPPEPDGQQDARHARYGLLQRLRKPAPTAPRLDQPTEPQEP